MAEAQVEDTPNVTQPEDLERDIERTRSELAVTIDAIADRVSPKRVASRGVASAKEAARNAVTNVQEQVTRLRNGGKTPEVVGHSPSGATAFQVKRRPPNPGIVAGAVAVGGLALGLLLRRRKRS